VSLFASIDCFLRLEKIVCETICPTGRFLLVSFLLPTWVDCLGNYPMFQKDKYWPAITTVWETATNLNVWYRVVLLKNIFRGYNEEQIRSRDDHRTTFSVLPCRAIQRPNGTDFYWFGSVRFDLTQILSTHNKKASKLYCVCMHRDCI
jgi:hypothetical protein